MLYFRIYNFHPNYLKKSPIDEVLMIFNWFLISYVPILHVAFILFFSHGNMELTWFFGPIIVLLSGYVKLICRSTLEIFWAVAFMELLWLFMWFLIVYCMTYLPLHLISYLRETILPDSRTAVYGRNHGNCIIYT